MPEAVNLFHEHMASFSAKDGMFWQQKMVVF